MPSSFTGGSVVPVYAKSKIVLKNGGVINSVYVKITYTGSIKFHVCADGSTETWEEVENLSSGSRVEHSFSTTGTEVKWYAVLARNAEIRQIVMSIAS